MNWGVAPIGLLVLVLWMAALWLVQRRTGDAGIVGNSVVSWFPRAEEPGR